MNNEVIDEIKDWASQEEGIQALILVGSRARRDDDELSDYDISVFCASYDTYAKDDQWLSQIGKVWVCLPLSIEQNSRTFPTRLVIFEGGVKVDFAFYTLDVLENLVNSNPLPEMYDNGYQVLLDKEGRTQKMVKPSLSGYKKEKPSEKEFVDLIKEFWFEVYHVAKYLKREDLWSVKFRASGINHHLLLKMIEWNEQAKHNWNYSTYFLGGRMKSWVGPSTWEGLHGVFAHFDKEDSWKALKNTIELFRKLSIETAKLLDYEYPHDVDVNIDDFIQTLRQE